MKIMSYNVNGIRARLDQLRGVLDQFSPDIIGLQETKVTDEEFPLDELADFGYNAYYTGQKTHYGVALLSKLEPVSVTKGFPEGENEQKRLISATFDTGEGSLHVLNGYYPQGENRDHPVKFPNKEKYYADMHAYLRSHFSPDQMVVLVGDMNVAPVDDDIGIGEDNAKRWLRQGKSSFLPEERGWLAKLLDWGLHDTWRERNPEVADCFSWFDYRSRGFERDPKRGLRIDLILASRPLMERCSETGIDYNFRAMKRPSDHCPIWADFDI